MQGRNPYLVDVLPHVRSPAVCKRGLWPERALLSISAGFAPERSHASRTRVRRSHLLRLTGARHPHRGLACP